MPTSDEAIKLLRERTGRGKPPLTVSRQEMSSLGFVLQLSIALDRVGIGIHTLHKGTGECCLWHAVMERVLEVKPYEARLQYLSAFFELNFEPGLADVSAQEQDDWTPLMQAAMEGQTAAVRALLEAGADVNAREKHGWRALTFAADKGSDPVIRVLLEAGADINGAAEHGYTALMAAGAGGHQDAVRALLEAGADVNAKDQYGATALMSGAQGGHPDVVRALLEAGAEVNAEDEHGGTALDAAGSAIFTAGGTEGHHEIIQLLRKAAAKP